MSRDYRFPDGFLWGAATSAHQIEGSPLADGAGPSIWERFSHTPGRIENGDTGDIATDHYHRFSSDVELMHELGLTSYRFSIAWARILPEGTGRVNAAGLAFYDRLVDKLLSKNIAPMVTLYHWDLPAALDDRGGWLNRDIADWFADYARVAFRALGDRVPRWVTLNEPWVVMDGGYLNGVLAPGHQSLTEPPHVTHNLLRAHGAAVQTYRAEGKGEIGLVVNLEPKYPASSSRDDAAATLRADAYMNRQYLDPVFRGEYPAELREIFGSAWPEFPDSDWPLIQSPIDFLGINYYSRSVTQDAPGEPPLRATRVRQGGLPCRAHARVALGQGTVRRPAAVYHRKRRSVFRSAPCYRRARRRSTPRLVPARPSARGIRRDPPGRGPARILCVVAARQLRMELWVCETIRHRARGF
jgi:beta-glucosidase